MNYKNLIPFLCLLILISACWSGETDVTKNRDNRFSTPSASTSPTPTSNENGSNTPNKNGGETNININNNKNGEIKTGGFQANLPAGFQNPTDEVGNKMMREYGAIFVARGGAVPPKTVVFKNDAEVSSFQSSLQQSSENIGGFNMELQTAAMNALKEAIAEAKQNGSSITPNAADSGRRTYQGTVDLWASRVNPGLANWVGKGRLSQAEATRIKSLSPFEQVPEIFKLEGQGMFFSKDFSKSIIFSVAPPGTSQHLSMLALDVKQHTDEKVRGILARHGWYQTVVSDLPHFAFLGVPESELTKLGLKQVSNGGRTFWVPNL